MIFRFLLLVVLYIISFASYGSETYLDLVTVSSTEDGETLSANLETLLLMTALPFLSAAVIMVTPFMRCVIVFGLLRQALGTMHSPPNQVVVAMSLMLTFIVMQPTLEDMKLHAYDPVQREEITVTQAAPIALNSMKLFWLSVTSEDEILYFAELFEAEPVDDVLDLPVNVLIPAFVYSELKLAFKIAFMIFIPFLIIDIVVASTLMGMGMMMLSPMVVSLPFKIFAFVILDGWGLITTSLIGSYGVL